MPSIRVNHFGTFQQTAFFILFCWGVSSNCQKPRNETHFTSSHWIDGFRFKISLAGTCLHIKSHLAFVFDKSVFHFMSSSHFYSGLNCSPKTTHYIIPQIYILCTYMKYHHQPRYAHIYLHRCKLSPYFSFPFKLAF